MKMTKKGISPLIATVLIIGFTVALVAMVMTWGSGFLKKTTEETEESTSIALKCASELDFQISEASCTGGTLGSVKIDNRGQVQIEEVILRVISDQETSVETLVGPISAFGAKMFTPTVPNSGVPTSVEAIAVISGGAGKENVPCQQARREFTIATCA